MFGMVHFSMLSSKMINGLNKDGISEISDIHEIMLN